MTLSQSLIDEMNNNGREIYIALKDDPRLGPLGWLPGSWENTDELKGFGFNMMALPFGGTNSENGYRLLMNQYNEVLNFIVADVGVPNRGSDPVSGEPSDQTAVALSYSQIITQISSEDSFLVSAAGKPVSTLSKTNISDKFDGKGIHHEPGLWIYMTDQNKSLINPNIEINVARMGSIPHGNSFIAAGTSRENDWDELTPQQQNQLIPDINGIVIGGGSDPNQKSLDPIIDKITNTIIIDYFAPYRHFNQNPFKGKIIIPGFGGVDPVHATDCLKHVFENVLKKIGVIKRIKRLRVDSTHDHAGINRVVNPSIGNTPFITRQADTTAINSFFIMYEIEDAKSGRLRYFLQYAQNIILDFIGRPDGHPGRARWPHVSINTMERVSQANPNAILESLPARQAVRI